VDEPLERGLVDDVWLKQVPLKVSLFVWRLFRNRLPTKDNLLRRHVLHLDNITCVGGCGSLENAEHLLLGCDFFGLSVDTSVTLAWFIICCSGGVQRQLSSVWTYGGFTAFFTFFFIVNLTCLCVDHLEGEEQSHFYSEGYIN